MEAKIKHFIKLLKLKKELAKQVKENQTAIDWVEPDIRNYFGDQGIEKMTQDGLTIFIKRNLFAAIGTDPDGIAIPVERCIQALRIAGLEMYCEEKVKLSTLTSYFKELDEEDLPMPAALQGNFVVKEIFKMASRKA